MIRLFGGGRRGYRMRALRSDRITAAVTAAGLAVAAPLAVADLSPRRATMIDVLLTSGATAAGPLGDGTALIMGGTSIPQPSQLYLDATFTTYLEPFGFGGTLQSLFTPENTSATSQVRGAQILDSTILQKIADGGVSAENPLVVFGYSQSAAISSAVMRQLAGQDVPSDHVHFVLIGNLNNPVGGLTVETSGLYPQYLRTTWPPRTTCTRPTSTPTNTTVSPISRGIRSICCRSSTPSWA